MEQQPFVVDKQVETKKIKKDREYGRLAIIALALQNEKDAFIADNPNIIPGDE